MRSYKFLAALLIGMVIVAAAVMKFRPAPKASPASSKATPIDLSRFVNAKFTENLNCPLRAGFENYDMATFPTGRQVMANVPFDISGIVEVAGKNMRSWGRMEYPVIVHDIPINKKCQRVSILHGTGAASDPEGTVIAKLILKYEDNSQENLEIKLGYNTRDWWAYPDQPLPDKATELGWKGRNESIRKNGRPKYLCVYRTTFVNPKPKLTITSIDYASTMQQSSSFMCGMTVD